MVWCPERWMGVLVRECERLPGVRGAAVPPSLCVGQCSLGRASGERSCTGIPGSLLNPDSQPENLQLTSSQGTLGPRVCFSPPRAQRGLHLSALQWGQQLTGPDEHEVERKEWWKILDDVPTSLPWLWRLRRLHVLDERLQ